VEPLDIEKLVGELEVAVDRLRSLYDQYFMGIEKLEPQVPRKEVERRIQALRKEQIRNTAQRFRFQMILQRYNVYQTHWLRICREIENGTYRRHMMRAEQRFGDEPRGTRARAAPGPVQGPPPLTADLLAELDELDREFAPADDIEVEVDVEVELDDEPTARRELQAPAGAPPPSPPERKPLAKAGPPPAKAPVPAVPPSLPRGLAPPPRPAAQPPARAPVAVRTPPAAAPTRSADEDLPEERVRQLYAQYVDAKRRQNESTASITYDAIARSLRDSSAKLRHKHGKAVDFEVTVKNGKAILRPVLK
jgi:hypothetical protein